MTAHNAIQFEYDFTLVLTGVGELTTEVENALFEAGCDDGTLSVRYGRLLVTFTRAAPSLKQAMLSAIRDVRKSGVGVDVLRVDVDDLVSQADIARRIGRSRQLVHQYLTGVRGPGGFPAPACAPEDGVPLWSWCEIAAWLRQHRLLPDAAVSEAHEIAVINHVLGLQNQRRRDPALTDEVLRALDLPPPPVSA